jgi:hypothetical protein
MRPNWIRRLFPRTPTRKSPPRAARLALEHLEDRITPSFSPAVNFSAGSFPFSVAVGDFNSDGDPDLVTGHVNASVVSVLLGDGTGSFGDAKYFLADPEAISVAVGDFNGDANLDLAVGSRAYDLVDVLLGDGNGSFSIAGRFPVGVDPISVAVGDFDGDAHLDLAVTGSRDVSVLLGDGNGSFGNAAHFDAGAYPFSVAVGDLNGDGHPDLALTNPAYGSVSVLLGDGTGSFGPAAHFDAGDGPISVAVGDLNGDGHPDLAVANIGSDDVSVLLGDGTGSFGNAANFGVGTEPTSVAVGDFDGDGNPDLATANYQFSGTDDVSVLLGEGDGTFGTAEHLTAGIYTSSVAVGDFDGDGRPDLATANTGSNNVSVLLNRYNAAPVATDDTASTPEDTPVTIDVLANDTDIDGDTLTIVDVSDPAHGTAVISGGMIVYTPGLNQTDTVTLTYTVSDGNGHTDTATLTIDVLSPAEQIDGLRALVAALRDDEGALNDGQANALLSKLDEAEAKVEEGQTLVAANLMTAFIHQVEDFQDEAVLSTEQALLLLTPGDQLLQSLLIGGL